MRDDRLRVFRRIKRLLQRFARAHAFAIFAIVVRDLQARRVPQDERGHIERCLRAVDRPFVAHPAEQWQPAGMIEMPVGKHDCVAFPIRRERRTIHKMMLNFSELFFDLLSGARCIRPVESNSRGTILQPVRTVKRRQRAGKTIGDGLALL